MKPPSILVTGGAGFIGSHLVERLLTEGKRVTVIDDCSTGQLKNLDRVANHPGLKVLVAKVSECPELPAVVAEASAIYHLAAAVGVKLVVEAPIRTLLTNLHETEVILEAASAARVPTLLTSTSEVYGKSQKPAFGENDDLLIGPPTLGRWSYACSKLMDEFLALAYARERRLPVIIARLFNTVGPRQTGRYGMVLPRFIAAARRGEPLMVYGDGTQTRCFCFVHDTVEALQRLMDAEAYYERRPPTLSDASSVPGAIYNIGGTQEISITDLARTVCTVLQSPSKIQYIPYDQAYAPGFEDMQRRRPLIEKLEERIHFRPGTSLPEIIERTAASLD